MGGPVKEFRPWNFGADASGHVWEFVSYPWIEQANSEEWYINARFTPDDPTSMRKIRVTDIVEVCPCRT